MALEYKIRDGKLLWIKNPITEVILYVVDLRGKSFAFTSEVGEFARRPTDIEGGEGVN